LQVFAVFDGHDGSRAAGFASSYMLPVFNMLSWEKIVANANSSIVNEFLSELFKDTEIDFFKSIERFILEKESLQMRIPQVSVLMTHPLVNFSQLARAMNVTSHRDGKLTANAKRVNSGTVLVCYCSLPSSGGLAIVPVYTITLPLFSLLARSQPGLTSISSTLCILPL
jgi:serine/threonine protein phosphatase PrpC